MSHIRHIAARRQTGINPAGRGLHRGRPVPDKKTYSGSDKGKIFYQ
jgi:hypothetical protein